MPHLYAIPLLERCREARWKFSIAESCTGGLAAAALTEIPGASEVFDRGFVTYSNAAKHELLGVPLALLERYGAVSREVAEAMAAGALTRSLADIACSVTGIAGPGGGTIEKPVGLVYLACARKGGNTRVREHHFSGTRSEIRNAAVEAVLQLALECIA